MNTNHLQQIFAHYIEQFDRINNTEHQEYYKWQIIKVFHDKMENALSASAEEFPKKLYELKKLTSNLIDSYTQPFLGLVKFAEKEPETVRQMFLSLYSDDGGNIKERQNRVQNFLKNSHALRDKYYPDSYLYKDDVHSVTGYLFLYDPDHNYIFKATHALKFADCVEFYDDWGSGDTVKLDVYYRMCDQLVEEIKASDALLATDSNRFTDCWGQDPDSLYPDPEKHILAFDLIYCCSTYNLFKGITFVRPKTKERQIIQERKEKAQQLFKKLEEAKSRYIKLETAKEYINSVYVPGTAIHHLTYGDGIITENNGSNIQVNFSQIGEKRLGTFVSAANGLITVNTEDYSEKIKDYAALLKEDSSIRNHLSFAEKEFAPFAEYLD